MMNKKNTLVKLSVGLLVGGFFTGQLLVVAAHADTPPIPADRVAQKEIQQDIQDKSLEDPSAINQEIVALIQKEFAAFSNTADAKSGAWRAAAQLLLDTANDAQGKNTDKEKVDLKKLFDGLTNLTSTFQGLLQNVKVAGMPAVDPFLLLLAKIKYKLNMLGVPVGEASGGTSAGGAAGGGGTGGGGGGGGKGGGSISSIPFNGTWDDNGALLDKKAGILRSLGLDQLAGLVNGFANGNAKSDSINHSAGAERDKLQSVVDALQKLLDDPNSKLDKDKLKDVIGEFLGKIDWLNLWIKEHSSAPSGTGGSTLASLGGTTHAYRVMLDASHISTLMGTKPSATFRLVVLGSGLSISSKVVTESIGGFFGFFGQTTRNFYAMIVGGGTFTSIPAGATLAATGGTAFRMSLSDAAKRLTFTVQTTPPAVGAASSGGGATGQPGPAGAAGAGGGTGEAGATGAAGAQASAWTPEAERELCWQIGSAIHNVYRSVLHFSSELDNFAYGLLEDCGFDSAVLDSLESQQRLSMLVGSPGVTLHQIFGLTEAELEKFTGTTNRQAALAKLFGVPKDARAQAAERDSLMAWDKSIQMALNTTADSSTRDALQKLLDAVEYWKLEKIILLTSATTGAKGGTGETGETGAGGATNNHYTAPPSSGGGTNY